MADDRADLIQRLADARGLLAATTTYLEALVHYAPHLSEGPVRLRGRIDDFLNAGLFGDKQKGG